MSNSLNQINPLEYGEISMKSVQFIKTQVIILAIPLLFGCRPVSVDKSSELAITSESITPIPSVISSNSSGPILPMRIFSGHSRAVLDLAFSAQGEFLASSSQDRSIRLWDVKSGEEAHAFVMSSVDMADIDISLSRNLLASGEAIWDVKDFQAIHVLERGSPFPGFVAFSPDGSVLALGLFEEEISLWDVDSGQPLSTFERQEENRTKRMEFSPDGKLLAVGVYDGTVRLLEVESGNLIDTLKYSGESDIHDLAFSPEGKYLATGGRVPEVVLWDVRSREVIRTYRLTDNAISMDFSPDGRILASAGGQHYEVRLWDVESGTLLYSIPHNDQLTSVAFSPDGRYLAVGSIDSEIYVWEIASFP
jgi:WD40 repeat protein